VAMFAGQACATLDEVIASIRNQELQ